MAGDKYQPQVIQTIQTQPLEAGLPACHAIGRSLHSGLRSMVHGSPSTLPRGGKGAKGDEKPTEDGNEIWREQVDLTVRDGDSVVEPASQTEPVKV